MLKDGIHAIFPMPIFHSNEYKLSTKEQKLLIRLCSDGKDNKNIAARGNLVYMPGRNKTSVDTYILNNYSELSNLKKYFEDKIYEYTRTYLKISDKIKFYITQSWVNRNPKGSYRHLHSHQNSILSAVYFITGDLSQIIFQRSVENHLFPNFDFARDEYNLYNAETWAMPDSKNSLYLFPSKLEHSVPVNTHKKTRYTISFNVFIKGSIGKDPDLTELLI